MSWEHSWLDFEDTPKIFCSIKYIQAELFPSVYLIKLSKLLSNAKCIVKSFSLLFLFKHVKDEPVEVSLNLVCSFSANNCCQRQTETFEYISGTILCAKSFQITGRSLVWRTVLIESLVLRPLRLKFTRLLNFKTTWATEFFYRPSTYAILRCDIPCV